MFIKPMCDSIHDHFNGSYSNSIGKYNNHTILAHKSEIHQPYPISLRI